MCHIPVEWVNGIGSWILFLKDLPNSRCTIMPLFMALYHLAQFCAFLHGKLTFEKKQTNVGWSSLRTLKSLPYYNFHTLKSTCQTVKCMSILLFSIIYCSKMTLKTQTWFAINYSLPTNLLWSRSCKDYSLLWRRSDDFKENSFFESANFGESSVAFDHTFIGREREKLPSENPG